MIRQRLSDYWKKIEHTKKYKFYEERMFLLVNMTFHLNYQNILHNFVNFLLTYVKPKLYNKTATELIYLYYNTQCNSHYNINLLLKIII